MKDFKTSYAVLSVTKEDPSNSVLSKKTTEMSTLQSYIYS